jgi:uncharacterized SAM-binding protein YcdF (DUF218 family)
VCGFVRRLIIAILVAALGAGLAWISFPYWFPKIWRPILVVDSPPASADAIVLLGGESQGRPVVAARLFHEGVAPLVVITGRGDVPTNRKVLLQAGVPQDRILVETASKTTLENAELSAPVLRGAGIRRAVLVTSSFHARRALTTFQQRIPGIEFGVATSRIAWWDTPQGRLQEDEWAAIEMIKIPGYWFFHGIEPWLKKTAPEAKTGQSPRS